MKTCIKCGVSKILDQFGRHKQKTDGLRAYCKSCNNAEARAWSAANPEKQAAQSRRWAAKNTERSRAIKAASYDRHRDRYSVERSERYRANPSVVIAKVAEWTRDNPDKANANKTRWRVANPGKVRAASARRNADRVRATPAWLSAIQLAQIEEFYEIAAALNTQTGVVHHVDHIHPLRGKTFNGLHVPWNLQVLTADENRRKGAQFIEVP